MSRLRQNEKCPIHKSFWCVCKPERKKKQDSFRKLGPVIRVIDDHHPRGYRELCSAAELRRRKHKLLSEDPTCWICHERFTNYSQVHLEHREPKGMAGARRDDHISNLGLAHSFCNKDKGSRRIA